MNHTDPIREKNQPTCCNFPASKILSLQEERDGNTATGIETVIKIDRTKKKSFSCLSKPSSVAKLFCIWYSRGTGPPSSKAHEKGISSATCKEHRKRVMMR